MSYYSTYRWCAVPVCKNTSVKTPDKLWIQVPTDTIMRKTWFKLARRDLDLLFAKTRLYFCEDHFDLEHDMENYIRYKIMGSVKRIRLKPHCVPSKFDWNEKHRSTSKESHLTEAKRLRISKDSIQDHIEEDNIKTSSCIEDSQTALDIASMESKCDKAVEIIQVQDIVAKGVCKGEVTRLERVCRACWKSATRTMKTKITLDANRSEDSDTQDLSQEQLEQDVNIPILEQNFTPNQPELWIVNKVSAETCTDAGHSGRWDEVKVFAETCADAGHSGLWDEVKVENTDIFDDEDDAVDDSETLSVDSNVENTDIFDDEDNVVDDSDTLVDSNLCRVCLTLDVKTYDLKDIELREMFQDVTGIVVTENNHSILERLCWECAGRLKAAAGFRNKALHSDALLQGLADTGEEIRKNDITSIKENADYLKSGSLSVAEVILTIEIDPENESVPPISENNNTETVQNIVKNEPIELEESIFDDDYDQIDVKDELIIKDLIKTETDHDYICHNTEDTNPVAAHSIPCREDTITSTYSSPQVDPKKQTLGYVLKTPSDCEDIINKPVTKTTNRDAISKIVSRKSNQVIRHHMIIGDAKLKNRNVKVDGICKKSSNPKLVKKSQVKGNTSTDLECTSLEKNEF